MQFELKGSLLVLPSPSLLCSPHDRPTNQRRGAEARKTTSLGKPADGEDGRLVSLKNHLIGGLVASFFYRIREGEVVRE